MSVSWPDTLVAEIAEQRCAVFVGAGVSMGSIGHDGSTHPPNWLEFLRGALPLVTEPADRRFAKTLINKGNLLDAAEVIVEKSSAPDFNLYVRTKFDLPRYSPSELHRLILELDPKVVITTNYDEIYDSYCKSGKAAEGYGIFRYYDQSLVQSLRSRIRLVIKAHGCVAHPERIVLSRSSYYRAKRDYPGFYQVLDALFLTHTILFVGCSLTDPDIQLILENVNIAAPSHHPHYALLSKGSHPALRSATRLAHNIQLLEYPKDRHDLGLEAMRDLREKVLAFRTLPPPTGVL